MIGKNPVTIEGAFLVLRLQGIDCLWTLRKEIRVPLSSVEAVEVNYHPHRVKLGFRGPGLDALGKLVGTFRVNGVRNFWSFVGTGPVLEIRFSETEQFRGFYLSVDDPLARKKTIQDAVRNFS